MSRILAFDLSLTASGFCVGEAGKVIAHGVIPGKFEDVKRLAHNRNRVMDKVDEVKPDLVVFEDFSFGSNMAFAREIAGMAYMIRAELLGDKVPWVVVSPMSLKKFVCGSAGSAKQKITKDLIIKEIFKRWGHDVNDNNIADAIGLCYIGMGVIGEWEPVTVPQRAVLDTVRSKHVAILGKFAPLIPVQVGQPEPTLEW